MRRRPRRLLLPLLLLLLAATVGDIEGGGDLDRDHGGSRASMVPVGLLPPSPLPLPLPLKGGEEEEEECSKSIISESL